MNNSPEQTIRARLKIPRVLQQGRAFHFVWQSAKGWTIANGLLLVVQGVLPLLPLYLMKLTVDAVSSGMAAPDKGPVFRQVIFLVGLMGAVALLNVLILSIAGLIREGQSQVITDHMQDVLHAKSIEVDLEYYESAQYYDTLHRAQREASFRPTHIVNGLIRIGQNGLSLLAVAVLLFSFHWIITFILFLAVIPGIVVRLKYSGKLYDWQRGQTSKEREAWYYNWILTGGSQAKEIRLFDLGPLFRQRFQALRQKLRREKLGIAFRRSVGELAAQTFTTLAIYGSYAFIAYRAVNGGITLGDMVMYYQAFQRGQGFLQELLSGLAGLYEDSLFLSDLYEFLDLKSKVKDPSPAYPVPRPLKTGIVFDQVGFQYPVGTRKVLEDITLHIKTGEIVALVGENGSGKTTLIKLLCRLYDPTAGSIRFDGIDLRRFAVTPLRREISVIFQDYARYHSTARENIWFGNTMLPLDHERIMAAARRSGADEVIASLPYGYETPLGKWFENGEELSIGEWQKVALARAFMRDAPIIVLDEPTSSLDAESEYAVFKNFRQLAAGKTAVLISHRFSTVRMADRIFVLKEGRIIEEGSHEDLMRMGGTYARLFETQARCYR
ncbi:MAG: ABC transporter ATP-binding protein [Deltaproteobacteria bacterium]|nr:ABC transporter ATP-binding protein [Deltaproteobacteria bacterium]